MHCAALPAGKQLQSCGYFNCSCDSWQWRPRTVSMQDSSSCAYLAAPVRQHNGGPDSVGGPASTFIMTHEPDVVSAPFFIPKGQGLLQPLLHLQEHLCGMTGSRACTATHIQALGLHTSLSAQDQTRNRLLHTSGQVPDMRVSCASSEVKDVPSGPCHQGWSAHPT